MNAVKVTYRDERLEGGWTIIHVLRNGEVVGRITRDPKKATYRYFPGADNNLAFDLERTDLAELKRLLESRPG